MQNTRISLYKKEFMSGMIAYVILKLIMRIPMLSWIVQFSQLDKVASVTCQLQGCASITLLEITEGKGLVKVNGKTCRKRKELSFLPPPSCKGKGIQTGMPNLPSTREVPDSSITDTEMKDDSDPNDSEKGVMPDENLDGASVDAEMGNTFGSAAKEVDTTIKESTRPERTSVDDVEKLAVSELFERPMVPLKVSSRGYLGMSLSLLHTLRSRKEKSHPGGLLFTKFGSSHTTLLDLVFPDSSFGKLHDKSKETPKTMKQLTRLFPNKATIQIP
nr:ATPase, AAA-type, core [Tanacetum cinerariifolium]